MKNGRFHVICTGKIRRDADRNEVINNLSKIFGIERNKAMSLAGGKETVIKKNLNHSAALKYQQAIERAGLECRLEIHEKSTSAAKIEENRFTCPKCGYSGKRHKQFIEDGTCPSCGIIVDKYLKRVKDDRGTVPVEQERDVTSDVNIFQTKADDVVPGRFIKYLKWAAMAVGALIFIHTGISVFETPTYEIIYRKNDPQRVCLNDPMEKYHPELRASFAETGQMVSCLRSFRLDIFNAGMKIQPQTVVRLRLKEEDRNRLALEPIFLNFDRGRREVRARRRGDTISYALGAMDIADHVTLRMKVLVDEEQDMLWDDILEKIDVAKGDIVEGNAPKITFFARLILSVFNWGAKDGLEKMADMFLDTPGDDDMAINREFDQGEADLNVSIETAGIPGKGSYHGQPFMYQVNIRLVNRGPSDAENVKLTYSIPEDITIRQHSFGVDDVTPKLHELIQESRQRDYSVTPRGCKKNEDGSFTCVAETILPGKGASVFLMLFSEGGRASGYYSVEAKSDRLDPDESDNAYHLTIQLQ